MEREGTGKLKAKGSFCKDGVSHSLFPLPRPDSLGHLQNTHASLVGLPRSRGDMRTGGCQSPHGCCSSPRPCWESNRHPLGSAAGTGTASGRSSERSPLQSSGALIWIKRCSQNCCDWNYVEKGNFTGTS